MKIEDFRNPTEVVDLWPMLTFWSMLTSKIIGGWIQWPDGEILFKFEVNQMKIEDFRNLKKLLTFWPFDLKNERLLPYAKLYHVVKFCEDRFEIVTCRR